MYLNTLLFINDPSEQKVHEKGQPLVVSIIGTNGKSITEESWLNTIETAGKENKLWRVKSNSFLKGQIVPATSKEVLDNYLNRDFYKEAIRANSS